MLDTKSIPEDIPWPGIEKGRFGYEQWAARRRSHLNLRLATQTFVCLDAADQMKLALNRQIAVEKIAARLLRG